MTKSGIPAILSLLLCSACATTQEPTATIASPARGTATTIQQDADYMARVEHQARIRGVGVTWVNPPVKRTTTASR